MFDGQDSVTSDFSTRFKQLQHAIFIKRPFFQEIFEKHGHKTLSEYAKDYLDVNRGKIVMERQDEFLSVFRDMVARLLPAEVAESAVRQLAKYYFVSTSEHHGPFCSPFLLNSNLLASLHCVDGFDPEILQNVIVLSCSNISLNNFMFPRGLTFHSFVHDEPRVHRLSFLPSNAHASSIYNFRPYVPDEMKKVKSVLREKMMSSEIGTKEGNILDVIIDEIYQQPEIFACESFSDQITKTNFQLWKKFFLKTNIVPSNLIYLEQESVVNELLMRHHLKGDTVISHLLFDPVYDPLVARYFDGIIGAFSLQEQYGTYLFWGMQSGKNSRVQLWKRGNALVSNDGTFFLELTPQSVGSALRERRIVPSLLMVFIVLNLYYGLKCLGAFNQVNYLTFMKNAYIKMMADRGNYRSIEVCARAQTKEIIGDLAIAFMACPKGNLLQAMGLDLILYGGAEMWPSIIDAANQITLREALSITMPENYRIVYSEKDRETSLAAITPEEIAKYLGLEEKVRPCV